MRACIKKPRHPKMTEQINDMKNKTTMSGGGEEQGATANSKVKYLPSRFKRSGWWYEEVKRSGDVRFYNQFSDANHSRLSGYVVAIIRVQPRRKVPSGKILDSSEGFPSPSRFGIDGFFYMANDKSFNLANKEFLELRAKRWDSSEPLPPIVCLRDSSRARAGWHEKRSFTTGGNETVQSSFEGQTPGLTAEKSNRSLSVDGDLEK
jgi:hypothetical protein